MVDDDVYHSLNQFKWCAAKMGNMWYAVRRIGGTLTGMHRVIMGITDTDVKVDHKNRNGLDNVHSNLRVATQSQNALNNTRPVTGIVPYRGVGIVKHRYRATARLRNISHHLGFYDTAEEAARAYDDFMLIHAPDFARLNFPPL